MDRSPDAQMKLDEARQDLASGKSAEAEQLARQVLASSPGDPLAMRTLGEALTAQGRYNEAVPVLVETSGLSADDPVPVMLALAMAYEKMGSLEEAKAAYEAVLAVDVANPRAKGALAVIGFKLAQAARQPAAPAAPVAPVAPQPPAPPAMPQPPAMPGAEALATAAPAPPPPPAVAPAVPQQPARAAVDLPFDLPPDPDPLPQSATSGGAGMRAAQEGAAGVRYDLAGNPMASAGGQSPSDAAAAASGGGSAGMRPVQEGAANVRYDLAGNPIVDAAPLPPPTSAPSGPLPPNAPPQPPRQGPGVPPPGGGPGRYGPAPTYPSQEYVGEDPGDFSMANIKAILASPAQFFASMQGCTGYNKPVMFFAITYGITLAIAYGLLLVVGGAVVASMAAAGKDLGPIGASLGAGVGVILVQAVISIVVGIPMAIAGMFISAGIMHLFVMMFGGRGGYAATFRALCYSHIPSTVVSLAGVLVAGLLLAVTKSPFMLVLMYLPMLAGGIWSLVVTIIAMRELHWMSTGRAAGAVLTPAVIGFVLMVVISIGMAAAVSQAANSARMNGGYQSPGSFGGPSGGFGNSPGMQMPQPMPPPGGGFPPANR